MKWSILICAIPERAAKRLALVADLEKQCETAIGAYWKNEVEILVCETPLACDEFLNVGHKRNWLMHKSTGNYISFIDDDDTVAPTYIAKIYEGILTNPDVVCFNVEYSAKKQITHFSIRHSQNVNQPSKEVKTEHHHVRMPNHIMVVKRSHALRAGFPEKNFGEDTAYGVRLRGPMVKSLLKTEYKIEEVLYYYNFNPHTSKTHQYNPVAFPIKDEEPILKMDVVIVSDGRRHGMITANAIKSIQGDDANIIVVEKDTTKMYGDAVIVKQPAPFNYNQCLNKGAVMGNARLICFANNDVLFPKGFVKQVYDLVKATHADVVSFTTQKGFIHPNVISGYCFVMTRDTYTRIGTLIEDYEFWCADNVVSEQIQACGLKEVKSKIVVTHFVSQTLDRIDAETKETFTKGCVKRFNRDFNRNIFNWGKELPEAVAAG